MTVLPQLSITWFCQNISNHHVRINVLVYPGAMAIKVENENIFIMCNWPYFVFVITIITLKYHHDKSCNFKFYNNVKWLFPQYNSWCFQTLLQWKQTIRKIGVHGSIQWILRRYLTLICSRVSINSLSLVRSINQRGVIEAKTEWPPFTRRQF